MAQPPRGLLQEQQNDCQAALNRFIDKHKLSDRQMTVEVQETTPAKHSVKIEITPPLESGLPPWPIHEIAVVDASANVAAEVDRLLEAGLRVSVVEGKNQ